MVRLGEWSVENGLKINPRESKAICFTKARIKVPPNYYLLCMLVPAASSCKYLGIILRSDLSWAEQVNYTVRKAWQTLRFITRILRKGTSNTKSLAHMTLVRPILEYGTACWDPYREGQIRQLDGAKESRKVCPSHKQLDTGNSGVAREDSTRRGPVQSVLWRAGVERRREQIGTSGLLEKGRS